MVERGLLGALMLAMATVALACSKDQAGGSGAAEAASSAQLERGRIKTAEVQVLKLADSLMLYAMEADAPPANLEVLVDKKLVKERSLRDPWGNPLVYRPPKDPSADFEVCSRGPDGKAGTDDDICGPKSPPLEEDAPQPTGSKK